MSQTNYPIRYFNFEPSSVNNFETFSRKTKEIKGPTDIDVNCFSKTKDN